MAEGFNQPPEDRPASRPPVQRRPVDEGVLVLADGTPLPRPAAPAQKRPADEEEPTFPTPPLIPTRKLSPADLIRIEAWYEAVRDLAAKVDSALERAEEDLKDDEARTRVAGVEGGDVKVRDAAIKVKMAPHYPVIRRLRTRKTLTDAELEKAVKRIRLYQTLVQMGHFTSEE